MNLHDRVAMPSAVSLKEKMNYPAAASANASPASSSNFPSETDYLETPLSVWLGESENSSAASADENAKALVNLAPLDIWTAASIGHYEFVKKIVDQEMPTSSSSVASHNDLNARNKGGWTALMYASFIGHDDIVQLLLAHVGYVEYRFSKHAPDKVVEKDRYPKTY